MKRIFVIGLAIFFCFSPVIGESRLMEWYKQGKLVLKADPEFGKGVNWDDFFPGSGADVAVARDGSVFVVNPSYHNILKFNANGQFVKTIGQQGEGPGDLYIPGGISIMEDRFLVAGEHPESRRISMFRLSGDFHRVIRTQRFCFSPVALKNGRIAYYSIQSLKNDSKSSEINRLVRLIVIDTQTGVERVIETVSLRSACIRLKNGAIAGVDSFLGYPVLAAAPDGQLLFFGFTHENRINVFSPEGRMVRAFSLNISPVPVTDSYIRDVKQSALDGLRSQAPDENYYRYVKHQMEGFDFRHLFGDTLPFFRQIFIDDHGNVLVFKWPGRRVSEPLIFQVYSSGGEFLCESAIDPGSYRVNLDTVVRNIYFTEKGIIALLQIRQGEAGEDARRQLIRVGAAGLKM